MNRAGAFGTRRVRVKLPAAPDRAIGEGFETPGPMLVEYPLGDVPDPWHLIFDGTMRTEGAEVLRR